MTNILRGKGASEICTHISSFNAKNNTLIIPPHAVSFKSTLFIVGILNWQQVHHYLVDSAVANRFVLSEDLSCPTLAFSCQVPWLAFRPSKLVLSIAKLTNTPQFWLPLAVGVGSLSLLIWNYLFFITECCHLSTRVSWLAQPLVALSFPYLQVYYIIYLIICQAFFKIFFIKLRFPAILFLVVYYRV